MKVKKINDKLELENQIDIELQGCHDDCTEYFNKSSGNYLFLARAGFKVDGTAKVSEIQKIYKLFGFYCYRMKTPKTTAWW